MAAQILFKAGEATKLAVKRALNEEPTIDELIRTRESVKHDMFDPATGKWML